MLLRELKTISGLEDNSITAAVTESPGKRKPQQHPEYRWRGTFSSIQSQVYVFQEVRTRAMFSDLDVGLSLIHISEPTRPY